MNETTHIDLLRHGECQGGPRFRGSTDDPLTPDGWLQMWSAVEQDSPCWDRIIASPLRRCAEFGHALSLSRSIPCDIEPRVAEMHFGNWEGRRAADLTRENPEALTRFWQSPTRYPPPNSEPLADFSVRVLEAWNDVVDIHRGRRILLVTHGGVIRVMLCHLLGQPLDQLLTFEVGYGAMRRVRLERDGGALHVTINDAAPA